MRYKKLKLPIQHTTHLLHSMQVTLSWTFHFTTPFSFHLKHLFSYIIYFLHNADFISQVQNKRSFFRIRASELSPYSIAKSTQSKLIFGQQKHPKLLFNDNDFFYNKVKFERFFAVNEFIWSRQKLNKSSKFNNSFDINV